MIRLIFTILLASALWSCRTSKQSSSASLDTSEEVVAYTDTSHSNDDILSVVSASRDLDLSGITIEFFPPDSTRPSARPSPKILRIDAAKSKGQSDIITRQQSSASSRQDVSLSSNSSTVLQQASRRSNDFLRTADRVIFFSLLGAVIVYVVIRRLKSNKSS